MPTASRNPAGQALTRVRKPQAETPAKRAVRNLPATGAVRSKPVPQEVQFRKTLKAHTTHPIDHVDCIKLLEAAEDDHQQRAARLEEGHQQVVSEKAQLCARVRQLTSECRQLETENRTLKDRLETATAQDQMSRGEYKVTLKDLQSSASSLCSQITTKINECDRAYFSTLLPEPDVAQPWQDQDANYLLNPSDMPAQPLPGYSLSNLPTMPQLNPYAHVPRVAVWAPDSMRSEANGLWRYCSIVTQY
ncbi:uncharacterized protein N7515_001295 [Penicillium bovifimosum]|uniref:Uncharacterized protein n=1 Tax=Penicillium bovifimosum TaxID=126998 RepID=A0A9W9HB91_9EURO|nr:uncharacterized protein N7515_001295 [Penicillium bovifimosum]KAJ5142508.1 hypothetical protein N7515_001295 [Penicillium bovifimosum]